MFIFFQISITFCPVFRDSLDEVDRNLQTNFYQKSQMLESFPGSVVITCRTINWQERIGWVYQTQQYKEIELVPFKPLQQREFADNFFIEEYQRQRINQLFNTNYAMRYAARTPLLMTFICLGFRSGEVNEKTTYSGLYDVVIRNIMSGVWKNFEPSWSNDDEKQAVYIESMARIVWNIFLQSPETNRFSSKEWKLAAALAKEENKYDWIDLPQDFLKQLTSIGLLIKAGFDGIYPCYSFCHRTLLEYLAARGLSEKKGWVEIIYPHLWFEAGWVEVSKFVVGLVADATPLIERIELEVEDPFNWKLSLKCRIVGFANNVHDSWHTKVLTDVDKLLLKSLLM